MVSFSEEWECGLEWARLSFIQMNTENSIHCEWVLSFFDDDDDVHFSEKYPAIFIKVWIQLTFKNMITENVENVEFTNNLNASLRVIRRRVWSIERTKEQWIDIPICSRSGWNGFCSTLSLSPLNYSFVLNVQGEGILIDKMSNGAPQIVFKSCNLRQSICFIHTDKYTRTSIDSRIDI